MAKITLGKEIDLTLSRRFFQFNRDAAIRDVFDALVELITNSDDSYHRLFRKQLRNKNGGRILIEILVRRGKEPSAIVIRDRAEGMTLDDMVSKLADVGTRRSEEGDRGFMSRGAKDCTALGNVIFESIVDNKYYSAEITTGAKFNPLVNKKAVDAKLRKVLHIERGNGTVVTVIISKHRVRNLKTIVRDLPWHFALRDILDENSDSEVLIRNYGIKEKPTPLVYRRPEGELICEEKHIVPGYAEAKFLLKIWKSPVAFEDSVEKFRKSGFIIKAKRAIHECSLLHSSFEKDEYAKHYFGRVECPYIDTLMKDYDDRREKGVEQLIENPSLVIDPNRQSGLKREHPFTKALLEIPTQKLKSLIDKDREESEKNRKEISNVETKSKLNELAKAASKFLKEQVEDLEEISADDGIDNEIFAKKGILIFPTYANIIINTIRSFGLYVNKKLYEKEGADVTISSDSKAIEIIDKSVRLEKHKKKSGFLYGTFKVNGKYIEEGVYVEAQCEGLPKAEALFSVIDNKIEEREFNSPLEFEHRNYKIKMGSSKTLKLYAKYPETINREREVKIISGDSLNLPIKGRCYLVPVEDSNFACAEIKIEARRLVHKPITLIAKLNDYEATTKVKIIQSEDSGPEIRIELRDEDFGNYRATWGVLEKKPNLLKISAKHPSIKRYLGPPPKYEGQNNILFKTILAEIVAESVCRRSLELETQNYAWKFNWAERKEDFLILQEVFYQFLQRMRTFLPLAHSIMIKNRDITSLE